jgi:predicted ribosome quality control (RQC) complex YloA/Tae2 family protein
MRTAAERDDAWAHGQAAPSRVVAGGGDDAGEARWLDHELRKRLRRLRRRGAALRRQLEGDPAAKLRDLANLLLARKNEVPRGAASVSLTGFDGRDVRIALDPRLDAIRNAERLYDRASRRERAAREIPRRIRDTERRIRELEAGLEALSETGPSEVLWELAGGREATGAASGGHGAPPQLPYRVFRSSSGREIRVGRSSRANDELTFHHASPDDIWLHARQAAGAHVILRWDRRDQNPPPGDLTEAAVLAALHSEARHSGMVAVDWTRRKYVRKPRKAPAGAVVPERVSTLFVEPDATVAARLSVKD